MAIDIKLPTNEQELNNALATMQSQGASSEDLDFLVSAYDNSLSQKPKQEPGYFGGIKESFLGGVEKGAQLAEGERQVREQEGITQNTLRLRLNMSKAKLSYVLQELEKRNLIKRIKKGKTLAIYLRI